MTWIILVFAGVILYVFVPARLMVLHPFSFLWNMIRDLVSYIIHMEWRLCKRADLYCYTGLFGKGKTLSAVHDILRMYKKYNNKKVFDFSRKKWVKQKVRILSNVRLKTVPFEYMRSLSQIVRFAETQNKLDEESGELTLLFILIDEASVQLNCRSYKDNINPEFLNTLLTCRHYHICGIYCTSQRFHLEDKLLRDVTQKVIDCRKTWRFQVNYYYDAWEMENAMNPLLLKPTRRTGFFVRNQDYSAYDTLACVEELSKSCKAADMLSDQEILALRGNDVSDMDQVSRPSRKFIRLQKKRR